MPQRCRCCRKRFSVRTDSVMADTNLGYRTWALANYVLSSCIKGISSMNLVLPAARSGEVRLATWNETDLDDMVCTVPATRMKEMREHRVQLSRRAVATLDAARTLADGPGPLVFLTRHGKPISNKTLPKMRQHLRIAAVAHGFPSSSRDCAAEETDHPRETIEAALAPVVQTKVEAAHTRSDLPERRRLMDDEATYLNGKHGSNS